MAECELCSDEALPDEPLCRECQNEPDPDWEWDARHERDYR